MYVLTPLGLLSAFLGATKGETPKYYYAGFYLSLAIFLFPLVMMISP